MMLTIKKTTFTTGILICLIFLIFQAAHAFKQQDDRWILFHSKSGAYEVRIPKEYNTTVDSLRISPTAVIHNESLFASIDQRPFKNVVKNYSVIIDQSFGMPFYKSEMKKLINQDIDRYIALYDSMGGIVKKRTEPKIENTSSGELHMTYNDPELGLQGMRVRITTKGVTKYQQVLTGPDGSMYNIKAKAFFKSMIPGNGIASINGMYEDEWKQYISPLGIFTTYFPPEKSAFTIEKPLIENGNSTERISYTFTDPIRQQKLYYRIYGYKADIKIKPKHIQTLINKRHLKAHGRSSNSVELNIQKQPDGTTTVNANYGIQPLKNAPYVNRVKLYAETRGTHMIVHEIMSSKKLIDSAFTKNLIEITNFHPEKAGKSHKKISAELKDALEKEKQAQQMKSSQ
ncbi:MAG: hypothetical protein KAJ86_04865 [Alphaproteobacteria bacterium]|nr:hypothetical protein [Alphaproteobacteria bacterium]